MTEVVRVAESPGKAADFNARVLWAALHARFRQYPHVPVEVQVHTVHAVEGHERPDGEHGNALRLDIHLGRQSKSARRYSVLYEFSGRITLLDRRGPSRQYLSVQNEHCIKELLRRLAHNHNLH